MLGNAPNCARHAPARIPNCVHVVTRHCKENIKGLGTILLIVLILMLAGAIPTWPHSKSWGYDPSGGLGLIVVILILLLLMGRI